MNSESCYQSTQISSSSAFYKNYQMFINEKNDLKTPIKNFIEEDSFKNRQFFKRSSQLIKTTEAKNLIPLDIMQKINSESPLKKSASRCGMEEESFKFDLDSKTISKTKLEFEPNASGEGNLNYNQNLNLNNNYSVNNLHQQINENHQLNFPLQAFSPTYFTPSYYEEITNNRFNCNLNQKSDSNNNNNVNKKRLQERNGDWVCLKCKNLNFTFRVNCNICQLSKQESRMLFQEYIQNLSYYYTLNQHSQFNNNRDFNILMNNQGNRCSNNDIKNIKLNTAENEYFSKRNKNYSKRFTKYDINQVTKENSYMNNRKIPKKNI